MYFPKKKKKAATKPPHTHSALFVISQLFKALLLCLFSLTVCESEPPAVTLSRAPTARQLDESWMSETGGVTHLDIGMHSQAIRDHWYPAVEVLTRQDGSTFLLLSIDKNVVYWIHRAAYQIHFLSLRGRRMDRGSEGQTGDSRGEKVRLSLDCGVRRLCFSFSLSLCFHVTKLFNVSL